MFKIENGREQFWQWDINQKLIVEDATIKEVHFCNRSNECALTVEVKDGIELIDYSNVVKLHPAGNDIDITKPFTFTINLIVLYIFSFLVSQSRHLGKVNIFSMKTTQCTSIISSKDVV